MPKEGINLKSRSLSAKSPEPSLLGHVRLSYIFLENSKLFAATGSLVLTQHTMVVLVSEFHSSRK